MYYLCLCLIAAYKAIKIFFTQQHSRKKNRYPKGVIPLLSVSKVVSNCIVRLLQQGIITVTRASFEQLKHPEPVSQFDPEADGEVPTGNKTPGSAGGRMSSMRKEDVIRQNVPAIHIQVHPLSFLKAPEVSRHLRLFHGLVLQVAQALDKLNALVVFATDEGLLSRPQIQFLEGSLSQQTPVGVHTGGGVC